MISSELILKLKGEHPGRELTYLKTGDIEVVAQVPTEEEYQRFLDELAVPATKTHASRTLVVSSVVWPPEAEFRALLQRRPGVVTPLADDITELAGLKAVTERKKL